MNGTVTVVDKKSITFNTIRKFITTFATACHLTYVLRHFNSFKFPCPISLSSSLMLHSHLRKRN